MESPEKSTITVETTILAPVQKVWEYWTKPEHIVKWNNASDDWHTPHAENDLRTGGRFLSRMSARDGSASFDFSGEYEAVVPNERIKYKLADGRKVVIDFTADDNRTTVRETFDAEGEHTPELQRAGWQSILDNFKKYTEAG